MKLLRLGLLLTGVCPVQCAETARYFEPWHADGATLAPDGRHIAYFQWDGERKTDIVIVDCDNPGTVATGVLPERPKSPATGPQRLQWPDNSRVQAKTRTGEWWTISVAGKVERVNGRSPPELPPAVETPGPDEAMLADKFPERSVTVCGWDLARNRAVLLVTSREEAGRYFLYDRGLDQLSEFVRRMPHLTRADLAAVRRFSVPLGADQFATATTAEPALKPARPLPAVIFCRDDSSPAPLFEPELHALVAAGFVVIELSPPPGAASAPDQLTAALAALAPQLPLDSSRVALVAEAGGARLAYRALAEHPERFSRAAIVDGPFTLRRSETRPVLRVSTEGGKLAPALAAVIAFLRQSP